MVLYVTDTFLQETPLPLIGRTDALPTTVKSRTAQGTNTQSFRGQVEAALSDSSAMMVLGVYVVS